MKKKVAFLITVYKNDNITFFRQAIESIYNQDYGFEYINVYLGIDGYIPIEISNFIDTNRFYFHKIIKNEKNMGLSYTLNKLIDLLDDEEYIFRMDSDDICKFDRVSKQIKFMEKNQDIEILGGAIEEMDENGNIQMIRTYPKNTLEAKRYIAKASIFAHPTVCFRRTFFTKNIKYNDKIYVNQDIELWFRVIISNIQVANLSEIVLTYRRNDDFYKRRNYKKAVSEFKIYFKGIINLYGYNWRLIYPIIRLILRLLPCKLVKFFYNKNIRSFLNS